MASLFCILLFTYIQGSRADRSYYCYANGQLPIDCMLMAVCVAYRGVISGCLLPGVVQKFYFGSTVENNTLSVFSACYW